MTVERCRERAHDRGSQVVEFALIVPVVLLIIGAAVQFGFMYNAQVTVTQAAREGARIASLNPISTSCDQSCVEGIVKPRTITGAPGLSLKSGQISVIACAAGSDQKTDAVVIVTYTVNLGAPLLSQTVHVHGKAHMPCGG